MSFNSTINRVTVLGFANKDAKATQTKKNIAVTNVTLITTWNNAERNEVKTYHPVVFWQRQAEFASKIRRGDLVLVEGRLSNNNFTDGDGNIHSTIEITADKFINLSYVINSQREKYDYDDFQEEAASVGNRSGKGQNQDDYDPQPF